MPAADPNTADTVINEALVELGVDPLGDTWQGSRASEAGRAVYDTVLRGMHASAQWNFARRQRQLDMRADAIGEYSNNRLVPAPWRHLYEWPNDCVHFRFVLALNATALDASGAPVYPQSCWHHNVPPAPFLVTDAPLVNDIDSDWPLVEGHSPESTRVVATDQLGAVAVYTGLMQYPDAWPPLFKRALVANLAARFAMSAVPDKALARAMRGDMAAIARDALVEARVQDANEGWTMRDHVPDWLSARFGLSGTLPEVY
jgi:hypothetical protein